MKSNRSATEVCVDTCLWWCNVPVCFSRGMAKRLSMDKKNWHNHPKSSWFRTTKSNENLERVQNLLKTGCHVVIRIMTKVLNMNKKIKLWDLDERCGHVHGVCVVTMPKVLAHNQKIKSWNKHRNCQTNRKNYQTLDSVIIGDESWVFSGDPKIKRKASSGQQAYFSDHRKKARMPHFEMEILLNVFSDNKCIVRHGYLSVRWTASRYFSRMFLSIWGKLYVWRDRNFSSKVKHNYETPTLYAISCFLWSFHLDK